MRGFEDAQTGAWMSELDNELLLAELAAKDVQLAERTAYVARVEVERDVLERVMTNALRVGTESALHRVFGSVEHPDEERHLRSV